jgi:hypothetical protein
MPFTVRAWPVNSAMDPVDMPFPRLGAAIDAARSMAGKPGYRSVQVLDVNSMCFAQFNLLWNVPDDYA